MLALAVKQFEEDMGNKPADNYNCNRVVREIHRATGEEKK